MEKYTPNRARFFVRKKYTTFSTVRIVALRSVNKIFSESYDFAAKATSAKHKSLNLQQFTDISDVNMSERFWTGRKTVTYVDNQSIGFLQYVLFRVRVPYCMQDTGRGLRWERQLEILLIFFLRAVNYSKKVWSFCLFVCFIYSSLSNFSAIRRLSPLPVTGLQI
jgi:hypothetical protein